MTHGRENMEVAALAVFHLLVRNVAKAEMNALVRCHGEFANPLMNHFLVACSILHHGDRADLVNNIPYLLSDPVK
jgi:hypothetical protein